MCCRTQDQEPPGAHPLPQAGCTRGHTSTLGTLVGPPAAPPAPPSHTARQPALSSPPPPPPAPRGVGAPPAAPSRGSTPRERRAGIPRRPAGLPVAVPGWQGGEGRACSGQAERQDGGAQLAGVGRACGAGQGAPSSRSRRARSQPRRARRPPPPQPLPSPLPPAPLLPSRPPPVPCPRQPPALPILSRARPAVAPSVRLSVRPSGGQVGIPPLPRDLAPPRVPRAGGGGVPSGQGAGAAPCFLPGRGCSPRAAALREGVPDPRRGRATSRSARSWLPSRHAAWLGEGSSQQTPKFAVPTRDNAGGSTRGPCGVAAGMLCCCFSGAQQRHVEPPALHLQAPAEQTPHRTHSWGRKRAWTPFFFGAHISEHPKSSGIPPPPAAAVLRSVPTPARMLHGPPGMAQSPAARGHSSGWGEPRGR